MSYGCVCRGVHYATERRREMRPMWLLLGDWNGQADDDRLVRRCAATDRPANWRARQEFDMTFSTWRADEETTSPGPCLDLDQPNLLRVV